MCDDKASRAANYCRYLFTCIYSFIHPSIIATHTCHSFPTAMTSTIQTAHSKPPTDSFRHAKLPRSLSASSLKNSLSKLAVAPLSVTKPVAALHANVKCVF